MATYDSQETSSHGGRPYYLYEFNLGETTYRFCTNIEDMNQNSQTWLLGSFTHTEIKQSKEISKNGISIRMPLEGDFANLYKGWTPETTVTVTLYRGHFGADDTKVAWKGRVASHNLIDKTVELNCESIFTSLRRSGIRARYQKTCRHALYTSGCGVNKEDYALLGKVTAADGVALTISSAATKPDGYFTGGMIKLPNGTHRMIASHVGSVITLTYNSRNVEEGLGIAGWGFAWGEFWGGFKVILYPGCDRSENTCLVTFDNIVNNGAFKYIPLTNPMGGTSII